jgi:CheY-like chemotaxis protein
MIFNNMELVIPDNLLNYQCYNSLYQKIKLLHSDDYITNQKVYRRLFKNSIVDYHWVMNNKTAKELLLIEKYDAVMSDRMNMEMSGIDFIDWVYKNISPRPYIIYHPTSLNSAAEKLAAYETGADLIIEKIEFLPPEQLRGIIIYKIKNFLEKRKEEQ